MIPFYLLENRIFLVTGNNAQMMIDYAFNILMAQTMPTDWSVDWYWQDSRIYENVRTSLCKNVIKIFFFRSLHTLFYELSVIFLGRFLLPPYDANWPWKCGKDSKVLNFYIKPCFLTLIFIFHPLKKSLISLYPFAFTYPISPIWM